MAGLTCRMRPNWNKGGCARWRWEQSSSRFKAGSKLLQFGVFQRQPLAARTLEIHLHAPVRAATFHAGNDSLAEFLVEHALADAPGRAARGRRSATEGGCGGGRRSRQVRI